MLKERLQVLISPEQRRLLEAEAKRRGSSVAMLVREAIEERYGSPNVDERMRAVEEIAALEGRFLTPQKLDELISEERDHAADPA